MTSRREFSPQTLSVMAALYEQPSQWQHGYALASQTGLKSGTLYPILIRLADQRLVEASWQEDPQPGRPRRHLYRLTAEGLASLAGALAASARQPSREGAGRPGRQGAGKLGQPSQQGAGRQGAGRQGAGRPGAGQRGAGRLGAGQPIGRGAAAPAVQ